MNKQILYIPLILVNMAACSVNPTPEITASQQAQTTPSKNLKHAHKKTPSGVTSLDIVNNKNRLHLLTGMQHHGQKSLWYQNSDDGLNWSTAVKILNDDNLAVKMVRGNDVQITAQGDNIVVTWTKYDPTSRFKAGVMQAARSSDAGQHWQYSVAPPDWTKGSHGFIDLSADDHAMHAVWLDSRVSTKEAKATQSLQYSKSTDGGLSWLPNKTLDSTSCSCCWNNIKSDVDGKSYIVYRDKQPSDMAIGVIDQQQNWQRLNHVGAFNWQFDGCPHIGAGLDFQYTEGHKRIHSIVGTGHQDHLGVHYLYSDDAGKSWSKAKQLGTESAIHADIASHDNGRVIAVWDMMTADGMAIYSAESKNRGNNWSKPKQLSKNNMRATHPRIVKTKDSFLALWTENDGQKLSLNSHIFSD